MIPIDFSYHKPASITEAVETFRQLQQEGKKPLYFNGGTEIITMLRIHAFYTDTKAVIDIKAIPECNISELAGDDFVIGASIPLAQLEATRTFPLLGKVSSRIADHTSRGKITLGGNICGKIKYKEAVLPLLLTDSELVIAGDSGQRQVSIHDVFEQQMKLDPGEFIVQIRIPKHFLDVPFTSKKQTKIDRISYSLLTVSAIKTADKMRFAFSGLCAFPFRSEEMETILNQQDLAIDDRISQAIDQLPAPILNDVQGSSTYRTFVLGHTLEETILELEGGN